jgi:hypothetical protein
VDDRRRSIVGAQPGATLQQVENADNDSGDSQDELRTHDDLLGEERLRL